jgi:phenylacetate-CoA ligase
MEDIAGILDELEQSQWLPAEELLEEQWVRFKGLIEYAYDKVPFYRRRFSHTGIEPGDIKSRVDLTAIPILTKADIKANYNDLQARHAGPVEMLRTSGSTGEPLRVIRDRASTGHHRANMFRQRRWFGANIGSFEATFKIYNYPFWERRKVRLKDFVLNRIRINERDLTEWNMLKFYRKLEAANPDIFYGFPSLMVRFAQFLTERSIKPNLASLNAIISTGEMLSPRQKETLAKTFNSPVVNEYGCTETGIIAIECPDGGWHVPVESCLVEIVPDEGLDLDEGVGRVVVTDLMNRAMPIIRYDSGDLAREGSGICNCERGLPTIEGLVGRIGSMVNLPDGRSIHSITFFKIFKAAESVAEGSIREFQVRLYPPDRFEIFIIPDINFNDEVLEYLRYRLEGALGKGSKLDFKLIDEIAPTKDGKFEKFMIVKG